MITVKKGFVFLAAAAFLFLTSGLCSAQDSDLDTHKACKYCGMNRTMFSHTRVLVTYDDGTSSGTCSLHCAAVELSLNLDKTPKSIEVGDYKTKNLIDTEKAFWVIGGSKPGVMTKRGKWAFASKADAEKFIKENGGEINGFEEAIRCSYNDMYPDTKMIREKRKMKKAGKMNM